MDSDGGEQVDDDGWYDGDGDGGGGGGGGGGMVDVDLVKIITEQAVTKAEARLMEEVRAPARGSDGGHCTSGTFQLVEAQNSIIMHTLA